MISEFQQAECVLLGILRVQYQLNMPHEGIARVYLLFPLGSFTHRSLVKFQDWIYCGFWRLFLKCGPFPIQCEGDPLKVWLCFDMYPLIVHGIANPIPKTWSIAPIVFVDILREYVIQKVKQPNNLELNSVFFEWGAKLKRLSHLYIPSKLWNIVEHKLLMKIVQLFYQFHWLNKVICDILLHRETISKDHP